MNNNTDTQTIKSVKLQVGQTITGFVGDVFFDNGIMHREYLVIMRTSDRKYKISRINNALKLTRHRTVRSFRQAYESMSLQNFNVVKYNDPAVSYELVQ